jgi:hypothetical protein
MDMVGYMSPFLSLQDLKDDIAVSNNKVLCACLQGEVSRPDLLDIKGLIRGLFVDNVGNSCCSPLF